MSKRVDEVITNTMRLLDELLDSVRELRKVVDEEGVVKFTYTLFSPRIVEAIEECQELGGYVAVDTKTPFTRKASKSEDELIKRIFGAQSEEEMDDQLDPDDDEDWDEASENIASPDEKSDTQAEGKQEEPEGKKQDMEATEKTAEKSETTDTRTMKKEDVRVILNRIAKAGFEQEIKNLLARYGAKTLGQVDPKDYAALVAEAEGLTDG